MKEGPVGTYKLVKRAAEFRRITVQGVKTVPLPTVYTHMLSPIHAIFRPLLGFPSSYTTLQAQGKPAQHVSDAQFWGLSYG